MRGSYYRDCIHSEALANSNHFVIIKWANWEIIVIFLLALFEIHGAVHNAVFSRRGDTWGIFRELSVVSTFLQKNRGYTSSTRQRHSGHRRRTSNTVSAVSDLCPLGISYVAAVLLSKRGHIGHLRELKHKNADTHQKNPSDTA